MPQHANETPEQWHARTLSEAYAAADGFDLLRAREASFMRVLVSGAIWKLDAKSDAALVRLEAARTDLLDAFDQLRTANDAFLADQVTTTSRRPS